MYIEEYVSSGDKYECAKNTYALRKEISER